MWTPRHRNAKGVRVASGKRIAERRHVAGRERGRAPEPNARRPAPASVGLDLQDILTAAGEVPYAWHLDTDVLVWGSNAADVLLIDPAAIATGSDFAAMLDPQCSTTRAAVVSRSARSDAGEGVRYETQYALGLPSGPVWVEDCGRWFPGPDG